MQYLDAIIYPQGETYSGPGVLEQSHFEFLKSYGKDDAKNIIFDKVLQGVIENSAEILKTVIYYEDTDLYHTFDVDYYYIHPEQMSGIYTENVVIKNNGVRFGRNGARMMKGTTEGVQSLIPVWLVPYLPYIAGLIIAIIGYLLASSLLRQINEIQYSPGGGPSPISNILFYGILLFGGMYFLMALTKTSSEARKWTR